MIMRICKIKLNAFGDIRAFVEAASNFDDEIDIVTGTHRINAKSLLGVMTLDLSAPLELRVHGDHAENFYGSIKSYLVA